MSNVVSMTAQQVFDLVCIKALQMKNQCSDKASGACLYRSDCGTNACFVGHVINNEQALGADGKSYIGDVYSLKIDGRLPLHLHPHIGLLESLQYCHDAVSNWGPDGLNEYGKQDLREIAHIYELNTNVLDA